MRILVAQQGCYERRVLWSCERDREDCELLSPLALWAGGEKITQLSQLTGDRNMSS